MLINSLYVTTQDEKRHEHQYRLSVNEKIPDGHEVTAVRPAGKFRFSSVLSPESLANLKAARLKRK